MGVAPMGAFDTLRARAGRRTLFQLLVLLVICVGVWLRTSHLTETDIRSPDERVYTQFAQAIANGGLGAYEQIFVNYAADPGQWIYPSPTRITHVLLFAGVMKVTGSNGPQAGAAVSWALSILSIAGVLWIGRRFFNRWVGLGAAMFLATYVVELEFARRAWGEATASFLGLVLFGLTCEVARRPRQWGWHVGLFAVGTVCLLTKETSIFAYGLCGLWLVGRMMLKARDATSAAVMVAGGLFSVFVSFTVLAALAGDPKLALTSLMHVFGNGLGANDWGAQYASGPWYQFIYLLWLLGPLTLLMAALGACVLVVAPAWRGDLAEGLESGWLSSTSLAVLLTIGFVAASCFGPNLQYMRIMAPANPSYCVLAALGAWCLIAKAPSLLRGQVYPAVMALLPVLFVLSSWRDYSLYTDVVVRSGMQDLAVRWIRDGIAHRGDVKITSSRRTLGPMPQQNDVNRSLAHCQRGEFKECTTAALVALQKNPELAEAWNNAAVGYAGLQRWDDAIRCANEAVRLKPDFHLAKNNLAWAAEQKALAVAAAN